MKSKLKNYFFNSYIIIAFISKLPCSILMKSPRDIREFDLYMFENTFLMILSYGLILRINYAICKISCYTKLFFCLQVGKMFPVLFIAFTHAHIFKM